MEAQVRSSVTSAMNRSLAPCRSREKVQRSLAPSETLLLLKLLSCTPTGIQQLHVNKGSLSSSRLAQTLKYDSELQQSSHLLSSPHSDANPSPNKHHSSHLIIHTLPSH
ncbi:hypothetical protein QQF64_022415 [Cirrhinus molitorella]|uniref:Uncharacterized protein n=1 Tax=Cirrhinus molitorella TaxID=172907 RepID=A0ABR3L8D0_9TELE